MEMRKPIDSPRIHMDFESTVPGIYQIELQTTNSYNHRHKMTLNFNIHCTENPRADEGSRTEY